jgi:V8-like Glu-specific endopeptidase
MTIGWEKNMRKDSAGSDAAAAGRSTGNTASPELMAESAMEWTAEDFLAAEPLPMPEITDELVQGFLDLHAASNARGGQTSAGGPPVATDSPDEKDTTPTGYAYPPPFNQHEVLAPYTAYPYCTVGKCFFTQNGGRYVASAASIGKNAIWTAGHVVHAGNNQPSSWSSNFVFVPGYKDGSAPFGQFTARQLFCRTAWYQKGNPGGFYEDMGGAILNPLNGKSVSQTVGWLGFAWNFNRNQVWTSLGYPAAPPFNGQRMFQDTAPYANDGNVPGAPPTVGIGCSMTGGCSGGPWVLGLGSTNYVNGNNSYRPNNQPLEIYSPYFGDAARSLMQLLTAS